jgi:hypothetical protein
MLKGIKTLIASVLAVALLASPASALTLSSLEKISSDSADIELNIPAEGYDFDATFLANNLELSYKATVENDEDLPIEIDAINLNSSEYDFLEYSYDGIEVGETIEIGESKKFTITVKTNTNSTQTVTEDYNLTLDYHKVSPTPEEDEDKDNPNTVAQTILKAGAIAVISVGAAFFIFARSKKLRHFAIIFTISSLGIYLLAPSAIAEEANSFTIMGKISFVNTYTVTVNPNGGSYQGSTNNTTALLREGEVYHVDEVTRQHFDFVEWEVNPSELDDNNDIEIHADTTIKAKWNEKTYTLTIKPNGGEYLGSTEEWSESFRPGEPAPVGTPEMEGYNFVNWTVEEGSIGTDGVYTGSSIDMYENVTLVANYEIKRFTITILPNGGTYHNSTTTFTKTVDWDTDYEIEPITRAGFDLKDWTKTVDETSTTLSADTATINVRDNITLEANWWSSTFYTVTIDPNGGIYDNKTGVSEFQVREGTPYTILEATRDGMLFHYWHYTGADTRMDDDSFTVTGDVNLTAEWQPIVARIERTGKLYPSIMAAHAAANPDNITDDIITLLVDTEEIVTNEKQVTLDLNGHTVHGYLTNTTNGNLTLINGEINNYDNPIADTANPHGAAVINNGTLTMGIDDYTDGETNVKAPNIIGDNIRLIGTDIGLDQNNTFYFYDGYIEGIIGLDGGYNGSPWFRDTFDGKVIHYFPFVDRNYTKDCQHVELENSDRAVSKTIENGEIYYYNLQDNIDTSVYTGYDIYAVRDFDASYAITVPEDTDIVFDLDGYTVNFGEVIENNGNFTIRDSKTGDDAGLMTTAKLLTNNGNLTLTNMSAKAITSNPFMTNNAKLTMRNSTISATDSTTLQVNQNGTTLDLDNDSYITNENPQQTTLVNKSTDLVINSGHITSKSNTIKNEIGAQLTITGGEVLTETDSGYNHCTIRGSGNNDKLIVSGGTVKSITTNNASSYAICDVKDLQITGGEVISRSETGGTTTINNNYNRTNISGGTVSAENTAGTASATAVYAYGGTVQFSGNATISATSTGNANTLSGSSHTAIIDGGTLRATSTNGNAYVIGDSESTVKINGGDLKAVSENGHAFGIGDNDYWGDSVTITGGKLEAVANNPDKAGIGIRTNEINMSGGEVVGSHYGINGVRFSTTISSGKVSGGINGIEVSSQVTLGTNDRDEETKKAIISKTNPEIVGDNYAIKANYVNFYDGILKGGSDYVNDPAIIKATPDGAHRVVETVGDEEHCWLEEDEDYLQVGNKTFNSLTAAYEEVQDGGTVYVIADATTAAVLPDNTKNITFDLGTFTLNYSQPLLNSGTMKIVGTTGKIINNNPQLPAFDNSGTLTIESGNIQAAYRAIQLQTRSTLNISGGNINVTADADRSQCTIYGTGSDISTNITGGVVSSVGLNDAHAYTLCGVGTLNAQSATLTAESNRGPATVIDNGSRYTVIEDSTITSTSTNGSAYASSSYSANTTINGNTNITVTAKNEAKGFTSWYHTVTINGGTITVNAENGKAYIISTGESGLTINGGTMTATSQNDYAYGIGDSDYWGCTLTMTGGRLEAITNASDKLGIGVHSRTANISGGTIIGTDYGIEGMFGDTTVTGGTIIGTRQDGISTGNHITIGTNDRDQETNRAIISKTNPEIKGGIFAIDGSYVNFYDGILKGGSNYVNDETIVKATPDGAHRVVETVGDEEHCWLEEDEDYLQVGNKTFNSLTAAYEEVQDGGTVYVIANATTAAVLPDNTKNITFDLGTFTLNYSQPLLNSGTMKIVGTTGKIVNSNTQLPAIDSTGTLTVESGHIASVYEAVKIGRNSTLNVTGGEIRIDTTADNSSNCAIMGDYDTAVRISGGEINANGTGAGYAAAICSISDLDITGGTITAHTVNNNTVAVRNSNTEVTDGTIIVTSDNRDANGFDSYGSSTTISGNTTINVTAKGSASGFSSWYHTVTINGGDITVHGESTSKGIATGERSTYINGGTITVISDNESAFGIGDNSYYGIYLNMTGGTITATANNPDKTGTGVLCNNATVTGGTIIGSTYGMDNVSSWIKIGENDGTINNGLNGTPENPVIRGGTYGIHGSNVSFYDGLIEGDIAAHYDRNIKAIADHANIRYESRTIDSKSYNVAYLIPEEEIAIINETTRYYSIEDAITAAQTGDTIRLLGDLYTYQPIIIPSDKDFTLNIDGNDIIAASQFRNSGKVTITNSNSTNPIIEYHENDALFTNSRDASLTLQGLNLKANNIAYNEGDLTFDNTHTYTYSNSSSNQVDSYAGTVNVKNGSIIESTTNGRAFYIYNSNIVTEDSTITGQQSIYLYNAGNVVIDNSTLYGTADRWPKAIQAESATSLTIRNQSKLYAPVAVNNTTLTIADSVISTVVPQCERTLEIGNNTTATLTNVNIVHTFNGSNYSYTNASAIYNDGNTTITGGSIRQSYNSTIYNESRVIHNHGAMTITNTAITQDDYASDEFQSVAIYNDTDTTLNLDGVTITTARMSTTAIALHNERGATIITNNASLTATGKNARGLEINSGSVTLGVEETDPNKRGTEYADISTTYPLVSAIGTNSGNSVVLESGAFNFYDGKLVQSNDVTGENENNPVVRPNGSQVPITNVELRYEPWKYADGDNFYFTLRYMREQP